MMEFIGLLLIMIVLIIVLVLFRLCSLEDDTLNSDSNNIQDLNSKEEKSLKNARIFYFVSSSCFIIIILLLNGLSLVKEGLSMGFVFIYLGLGGLISKSGFLKLQISLTSKLYYVINPMLIIFGIYAILSYYAILNF